MFENTSPLQTSRETSSHRRALPDGGTEETVYLRYGDSAESVGEPDKVFGRVGDSTYVLVPKTVLGWSIVEENEVEQGVIDLEPLEGEPLGMLRKEIDYIDLEELSESIVDGTELSAEEGSVLLLYEGFEMDPPEIASNLDLTEETVKSHIRAVYDEYSLDNLVETVREHTNLSPEDARIFVLADGFALPPEEVAAELDVSKNKVERSLEDIRAEYSNLDLSDLLFGQR
jgi:DNA-directed RNA polymerase specialized sigma24 family protein